jgi:Subtilase family
MIQLRYSLALATVAALATGCSGGTQPGLPPATAPASATARAQSAQTNPQNYVRACNTLGLGEEVLCDALVRTDVGSRNVVKGFTPSELRDAYGIPQQGAPGQTVGIVDAQDDPNAEFDMGRYRAHFGLPPCTTANGCFRKLNQAGIAGDYPSANANWAEEISLDLDMVSAMCPACHILLVEGTSPSFRNLGMAVDTAVAKGATVVSNSYGGVEFAATDKHYDHKGVTIVASTGDHGFAASPQQPASFGTVVAVGGTSLVRATGGRRWAETAWSDAGAGCSQLVAKPAWQHDTGCAMRMEADVSAVADPHTGVAVYDSFGSLEPWLEFGGTSVSTPIVASLYALAGNAATQNGAKALWLGGGSHLFDVVAGNDGTCLPLYFCNASTGYDGPTGWGTPNGLLAL